RSQVPEEQRPLPTVLALRRTMPYHPPLNETFENSASHRQVIQQRLRLLQIARVEPLRKPPVNRSEQFACLLHLALVTPEACEAGGSAEFPGFGLLLAGDG